MFSDQSFSSILTAIMYLKFLNLYFSQFQMKYEMGLSLLLLFLMYFPTFLEFSVERPIFRDHSIFFMPKVNFGLNDDDVIVSS